MSKLKGKTKTLEQTGNIFQKTAVRQVIYHAGVLSSLLSGGRTKFVFNHWQRETHMFWTRRLSERRLGPGANIAKCRKMLLSICNGLASRQDEGQHGETSRLNSALWASQTCLAMWCQRLGSAPAIPPSSSCHPTRHRYALAQTSVFARYNFSFSQEKKSFSIFFGDIKLHAKTEQAWFFFFPSKLPWLAKITRGGIKYRV